MKELNLQRLKNTQLPVVWERFVTGEYNDNDSSLAIQLVLFLTSCQDSVMKKIGYRLSIFHFKNTGDPSLIHAVSSTTGLVPVYKSIFNNNYDQASESIIDCIRDSFAESLEQNGVYFTFGQKVFQENFLEHKNDSLSVVAPTSYGKSTLISMYIKENEGNLGIIVPTKSLLSQTRSMLLSSLGKNILSYRKIITHHEMYQPEDNNIISVLTQERHLKLLQENPKLTYKFLVIDESHNLFSNDPRSRCLASSIVLTLFRNQECVIKYLSPFIADSNSLATRLNKIELISLEAQEYIKSERIIVVDFRKNNENQSTSIKSRYLYDQFMNKEYLINEIEGEDEYSYIINQSGNKNIIYLNRPQSTHFVANSLCKFLPDIKSDELEKACADLAEYLHKDYLLVNCLRKGIIFHHGSIPDSVRSYVESLYKRCLDIKFVITTSTLLEGVNLPAEKMFVLSTFKGNRSLSKSQMKNLIGRVSRLNDVFASKNLLALIPEIHFVGNRFVRKGTDLLKFVKKTLNENLKIKDKVENPMLENSDIDIESDADLKEEISYLGNIDIDIVQESGLNFELSVTEAGQKCFLNRLTGFNILEREFLINDSVIEARRMNSLAKDSVSLIEIINHVFLRNIPSDIISEDDNLIRLRDNFEARDFYAMILDWRISAMSYPEMISKFLSYWNKIESDSDKKIIYAGKWGTRNRDEFTKGNYNNYVDISVLNESERVTLAISRIEAEMSYLDYHVMKYIECIKSFGLIDLEFYDRLKFGSSNEFTKLLMQSGMSSTLAKFFTDDYFKQFINFYPSGVIAIDESVISIMELKEINGILINEALQYVQEI